MQHKMLKLSTLAVLIAGVTQANAAVYKVVEVDPSGQAESSIIDLGYEGKSLAGRVETYAEAIQVSTPGENCFEKGSTCITDNSYKVAGESRVGTDGINYREEVAFTYDLYHEVNDLGGFTSFCANNLGFNTCTKWAEQQYYGLDATEATPYDGAGYGGLHREHAAWSKGYFANAVPLAEETLGSLKRVETFASDSSKYNPLAVAELGDIVNIAEKNQQSANGVVSGLGKLSGSDYTFGVSSSAYFENGGRYARQFNKRGFVNLGTKNYVLNTPATGKTLVERMGQTLASDAVEFDDGTGTNKLLVVGSASFANANFDDTRKLPESDNDGFSLDFNKFKGCAADTVTDEYLYSNRECQHAVFANDAYFWIVDPTNDTPIAQPIASRVDKDGKDIPALDPDEKDRSFQGAARAVALVEDKPVIAGYSTQSIDNDFYAITATVFMPNTGTEVGSGLVDNGWERKPIPGIEIKQGGDRKYRYTIATDVNSNNLVVGVGKNFVVNNRSYAESMFVFDNKPNGSLKMLDSSVDRSVFFPGSNGFPAAINNNDQLVGWIDVESVNQVDGRQRRQRAFTYMAGGDIVDSPLKASKAWLLDDLTYDSDSSNTVTAGNNSYRIAHATDINDAGVISATAYMCTDGKGNRISFDTQAKDSTCNNNSKNSERVVAVKLIPVPGGDIQQRPEDNSNIDRQGASFGIFGLTLLGLIGFRRRK